MPVHFHSSSLPSQAPSDQKDSDLSASATTSNNTSATKKSTDSPPYARQSGHKNSANFSHLFLKGQPPSTKLPRNRQRVSIDTIGRPQIKANTAFQKIPEPSPNELNYEIEEFARISKDKNNSGAAIDWEGYASRDSSFKADIMGLKARLAQIDDKTNSSIAELRLTAYEDIRKAKAEFTPKYQEEAKKETPKRRKEYLSLRSVRQQMEADRLARREALVQSAQAKDVQEAIGRFKQRVNDECEPGRRKDIRNACVKLIREHFKGEMPRGLLFQLVCEISSEAREKLLTEFLKHRFGADLSLSNFSDDLFLSLPNDVREFLRGASISELDNKDKSHNN